MNKKAIRDVSIVDLFTEKEQKKRQKQLQTTASRIKKAFGVKYPLHPQIMTFLEEHWYTFLDNDDAVEQLGKVFEISEQDALQAVDIVSEELGSIEDVQYPCMLKRNKVNEERYLNRIL